MGLLDRLFGEIKPIPAEIRMHEELLRLCQEQAKETNLQKWIPTSEKFEKDFTAYIQELSAVPEQGDAGRIRAYVEEMHKEFEAYAPLEEATSPPGNKKGKDLAHFIRTANRRHSSHGETLAEVTAQYKNATQATFAHGSLAHFIENAKQKTPARVEEFIALVEHNLDRFTALMPEKTPSAAQEAELTDAAPRRANGRPWRESLGPITGRGRDAD